MKTFADILYAELGEKDFLRFTGDSANNYQILEQIVSELNTSKCTLKEVEIEHEGTGHYLAYLLQKNKNINCNLCENYKTWMNHNGWQRG